ncbi:sensor domain-containing diguanylate cyclase [Acuticoccus kandeliae]|uniref:sensor domain-containing diguanylate cyclase n=1 Tax=Acuticoccus kandeliae TaxID=2073160 RepID=UPI000D3E83A6|nr:sensor domain-containing diguanylate cyclase [Acuticoccus kandeliae]
MDTKLIDEEGRLAAVRRLDIFDTPQEAAFDHITNLVRATLNVPMSAVTLIDHDRQWFKSTVGINACETAREDSFCTVTIRQREPMVVENALEHPLFRDNVFVQGAPFVRSYAGAPLVMPDGYQVGALCAIGDEARTFSEFELSVLSQLARCVVQEMELRQRASLDPLTGLMCRHPFLKRLQWSVDAFARSGEPAALSILDLDHFKSINDRFGHDVGDRVLSAVAETCRNTLGHKAHFGRLGGEEFAIGLPGLAIDDAHRSLERTREAIASIEFLDIPELRVSASFGLAELGDWIADVSHWCKVADVALYAAKKGGRNQIVVAGPSVPVVANITALAVPYIADPDADELPVVEAAIATAVF